jgi:hypothetical protein
MKFLCDKYTCCMSEKSCLGTCVFDDWILNRGAGLFKSGRGKRILGRDNSWVDCVIFRLMGDNHVKFESNDDGRLLFNQQANNLLNPYLSRFLGLKENICRQQEKTWTHTYAVTSSRRLLSSPIFWQVRA